MTRVALIGASGYTGAECLRLLRAHPYTELTMLCAGRRAGEPLEAVLPSFVGVATQLPPLVAFDPAAVAKVADFALLALPHGTAQDAAHDLLDAGVRVIDLSADHRFSDPETYGAVYPEPHRHPARLAETVYGLPELPGRRAHIRATRLLGCPGCFPTSVTLAAAPAFGAGILSSTEVIADCKSGVSGAGRSPGASTHFPETAEGLRAYKTLAHRHAPEMAMALGGEARVHFVPHLVPMIRGILSTVYLRLAPGIDADRVRAVYDDAYEAEPFVAVLAPGRAPDTRHVRGTNRAHLGLFVDGDLLVVQAAIDNLGKGAAGQALQCLNLMAGLAETTGLEHTAAFP